MENKKAVIYARFSPRKNAEQCESIEAQIEFCREYCQKNNIEVVEQFSDRALSGGDEDRPGLWNAIDCLKKNYLLVVYKLDRLARSVYLSYIIENAVKTQHKAAIVSISGEGTWSDTDEDQMVRGILRVLDEYNRKVIASRTKAAMLRHQRNGRRMSHNLPYGMMIDPNNPARMVENLDEQKIIDVIMDLASQPIFQHPEGKKGDAVHRQGAMYRKIARELLRLGYKPRAKIKLFHGKPVNYRGKWHNEMIRHIIQRRMLAI